MRAHISSFIKFYFSSFQGLPSSAWRGVALTLIDSTLISVYYFLSIYFLNELHFSITTCATIISCYGLGSIAGANIGGKLSDKMSPTLVSAVSLLVQALGYLALIKLKSITGIMINTFILGVASYAFITSNHFWTLQRCNEDERMKAINLLSTASNLGFSLSAVLMGALMSLGFHFLFILVGSITLFASCYLFTQEISQHKINIIKRVNHISQQSQHKSKPTSSRNIIMLLMLSCVLLTGLTVSQLGSAYPIYIQQQFPTMAIQAVSILFALNSILVVLVETPLCALIANQNKMTMLGISALLVGIGMCMLAFSTIFTIALIACVIYSIGEIIFFSMAQFLCYEHGEDGKKGSSIGTYRMTYATSRVIGPAAGGYIYSHYSGEMVWYISAVIGLLCFTACMTLPLIRKGSQFQGILSADSIAQ